MSADSTKQPPTKTNYDSETPQKLIDFMSGGWAEAPLRAGAHPQLARLESRRDELSRAFPGCYLVVPAGQEHVRANDTNFRFRTASDFAYLMGDGEPGALLVMEPEGAAHRTLLFVPEHNRGKAEFFTDRVYGELWVGRHRGLDESQIFFGVDRCLPLQEIRSYLDELTSGKHPVRVLRGHNRVIDSLLEESEADDEFAIHLSEMRLVKDDYEIAELRKACAITKRGFEDVIRLFPRAASEREFEGAFWNRARIEANDVGYLTIAASGHNACTLHWTRNGGAVERGALLLLDAGVECDSLYTADITRTMPVNGRYSHAQRSVYDIVYEAQRVAIDAVAPGNDFLEPNRRAMRVLAEGLIDLGVLSCSLDEALDPQSQYYRRYTLHNVSHMLGLDVHDCARARAENYRYGTLREGMALTVEPGLYFQPDDETVPAELRGIGVRIEDDVIVTASGRENLSAILPSKADAVERWIAELTA
ncbi:MAG TPA: aminopeptidase P family protein [Candidatus Acidoferrales bacterium]|nr:aminopeptidase P family protein [Candidatus Acidoferrales bacterium]